MPSHHTRISIIGCGHVGTSCAYAIFRELQHRLALELRLNEAEQKALEVSAAVLQRACAQLQPA